MDMLEKTKSDLERLANFHFFRERSFKEKSLDELLGEGSYKEDAISYEKALSFGFSEYNIKDLFSMLILDTKKEYKIEELRKKLTLEIMFIYPKEILKIFGKEEFRKKEEDISKNAFYSYVYATEVLNGPFELGEKAIAEDRILLDCYNDFLREQNYVN